MTNQEIRVISKVIDCLNGKNMDSLLLPHLAELREYLDSWVIPALDLLIKRDRTEADVEVALGLVS